MDAISPFENSICASLYIQKLVRIRSITIMWQQSQQQEQFMNTQKDSNVNPTALLYFNMD
jgi:hypothetical protein